jgi:glutaredoxin
MPGVPQIETGGSSAHGQPWNPHAKLIHPPDMDYPGAACPPVPDDVILVPKDLPGPTNDSVLYPHTEVFFEGWAWDSAGLGDSGHKVPSGKEELATCHKPHPFYTQYTNAYANDTNYTMGMPTLGSKAAHPNAVLKAADTLAEMLKQVRRNHIFVQVSSRNRCFYQDRPETDVRKTQNKARFTHT